eukprot:CAMPEP_0179879228 /NCGR_PEP_ID=MMETSP0982-20121206/26097_1 /TAXON_ID=483367 /ORGANISM="non described non described, Strain CCMP 2436" /LENGTH=86 /DNA_ID=CAMNT_0021772651 /DNA_START=142 /DNA_END=401 /DNA_ORIENTATION=+
MATHVASSAVRARTVAREVARSAAHQLAGELCVADVPARARCSHTSTNPGVRTPTPSAGTSATAGPGATAEPAVTARADRSGLPKA